METLLAQVRRARRRLAFQRFVRALPWCLFATLALAAVLIAVDKFWPLGPPTWSWAAGAVGLGLAAAAVWTWLTRRSEIEAAIEIDHRFGLRERVSSALSLAPSEADSEMGRAVIHDAVRQVERVEIGSQFKTRLSRSALLPLAPAAAAFLIAVLLNPMADPDGPGGEANAAVQKRIKQDTQQLRKKIQKRRELAAEKGLKEAEPWLTKLEKSLGEIERDKKLSREKALVKLNDLNKELQRRRQALGGADKVREQFKNLQDVNRGPADKLGQALRDGDFKKAMQELENLKRQLAAGEMDQDAKAQLEKQMEAMQKKLQQMADAQQQRKQQLQNERREAADSGNVADQDRIEEQLRQLQAQEPQQQLLEDIANKLGQARKSLQQGQPGDAQQALGDMQQQLDQLQQQLDEMQMLDDAMQQLADCKAGMCQGGQQGKQGKGQGMQQARGGGGKKNGQPGFGLGAGRGQGERPEQRDDTNLFDSSVKQKGEQVSAVITGTADGPNVRGNVREQIQAQFRDGAGQEADPLTGARLPRNFREHTKEYFNRLREGE